MKRQMDDYIAAKLRRFDVDEVRKNGLIVEMTRRSVNVSYRVLRTTGDEDDYRPHTNNS